MVDGEDLRESGRQVRPDEEQIPELPIAQIVERRVFVARLLSYQAK